VPRYHFAIDHGAFCNADESGTDLSDDAAARNHAQRIIRELKQGGGYDDPRLCLIVTDSSGREVAVLSFDQPPQGDGNAPRSSHDGGRG
jgi:hypothetical protein